ITLKDLLVLLCIHQSLIRSRRVDAAGWEFVARGALVSGEPMLDHVKIEDDPDGSTDGLLTVLEDWRFEAAEASLGDEEKKEGSALRYR
ncbi:hypothetical protein ACC791_37040, partial [Rhizobium ruizarguesonis]